MKLPSSPVQFRKQLLVFAKRSRETLLLAAFTGALTGLAVAGFDWLAARQMVERIFELPVAVQVAAPFVGLVLAALALRFVGRGATPSTSDEYIKNFHQPDRRLDLKPVAARTLASIATLGFGGPMGFEGPSIYFGASIGTALQSRFRRLFGVIDTKVLMVAGAAAGVAAIFKAPATGAIFALEVPFQDDTAKRMLLPALIASGRGLRRLRHHQRHHTAVPHRRLAAVRPARAGRCGRRRDPGRSGCPRVRLAGAPRQAHLDHGQPGPAGGRRRFAPRGHGRREPRGLRREPDAGRRLQRDRVAGGRRSQPVAGRAPAGHAHHRRADDGGRRRRRRPVRAAGRVRRPGGPDVRGRRR